MSSKKIFKAIWVSGIYLILGIMLYLVITYKVEWESKDLNTYLYFYDCDDNVCSSSNYSGDYYSKLLCEDDTCPYIKNIHGDVVILKNNSSNKGLIYNYKDSYVIDNKYSDYRFVEGNNYIVSDENSKYGIIDKDGKLIVPMQDDYLSDYKFGYISYRNNNGYGIRKLNDENINVESKYEDIVLINDRIFAGRTNNKYNIYAFDNLENNLGEYNYIYNLGGVLFAFNNKKIDILDYDLNSLLVMKIDTYFEYTIEKERASLNIHSDDNFVYMNVVISDNEYKIYKFNINERKISN